MSSLNIPEGINDPSDFKDSGLLSRLDSALRCPICKDFFIGPVLLSNCGHSFCSLCVREVLGMKRECPVCRETGSEVQLKKNAVLEDIVDCWKNARPLILNYTRNQEPLSPARIKRKRSPSGDLSEFTSGASKKPKATASGEEPSQAQCPVCQCQIDMSIINQHLDSDCKVTEPASRNSNKGQWASIFSGPPASKNKGKEKADVTLPASNEERPDRLALPPYDIMKDKEIRTLLKKQGLPSSGGGEIIRARHNRWVNLFNSNLDLAHMRPPSELKKDLKQWEQDMIASKKNEKTNKALTKDSAVYARKHAPEFQALVDNVRTRPKHKKQSSSVSSQVLEISD